MPKLIEQQNELMSSLIHEVLPNSSSVKQVIVGVGKDKRRLVTQVTYNSNQNITMPSRLYKSAYRSYLKTLLTPA